MDKTTQTRHPQRTGLHLLDALEQQSTISCRFTHQRSAVRYRPRPLNAASVSGLRKVEPDFAVGLRSRAIGRLRCVLADRPHDVLGPPEPPPPVPPALPAGPRFSKLLGFEASSTLRGSRRAFCAY